ncbi:unnamed protein product [Symbiodinium natans]|uniref:RRM domain-containing protein n=1 Tax=Symbiodinium natans TaxID=878477 RepID=A0A812KW08_9DINO|nr:unnamed protein product [Symbiodinium natans]
MRSFMCPWSCCSPSARPATMPAGTTALDLVQGITEYSSRIALKMLFQQFGEVTACWIPPLEHRSNERAYVKFGTTKAAQAAFEASQAGQLFLDGVSLKAEWRMAPARTQDARDFEARGSNLMTSRDLMRAQMRGGGKGGSGRDDRAGGGKGGRRDLDGGGSRALIMDRVSGGGSRRNDDRERDREKDRKGRERSRERDRKRKSRSRSRDRKRRERSRSRRSRSASRRPKRSEEPPALKDGAVAVDDDDEGTTAVI